MISQKDIYISANMVIKSHGQGSYEHAMKMAIDFKAKGADEAANVWLLIRSAIRFLQNQSPTTAPN